MRDTVYEMSRGKLGVTGVVDAAGRLVGCLSDGDLRRLLEHDTNLLERQAGECMHTGARTIGGGELASGALNLMAENRITSLFVCDGEAVLQGVVHIHDLWRLELF